MGLNRFTTSSGGIGTSSSVISNHPDWTAFFNTSPTIGIGDRVLYAGVEYVNLTGNYASTPPNQDLTNWEFSEVIYNNELDHLYLRDKDGVDGALRFAVDNQGIPTVEKLSSGAWSKTEMAFAGGSIIIGANLKGSAAGHEWMTERLDGSERHLYARSTYSGDETGTEEVKIVSMENLSRRALISSGETNEVTTQDYSLTFTSFGQRMISDIYLKTGSTDASEAVRVRVYNGPTNSSPLVWEKNYPSFLFQQKSVGVSVVNSTSTPGRARFVFGEAMTVSGFDKAYISQDFTTSGFTDATYNVTGNINAIVKDTSGNVIGFEVTSISYNADGTGGTFTSDENQIPNPSLVQFDDGQQYTFRYSSDANISFKSNASGVPWIAWSSHPYHYNEIPVTKEWTSGDARTVDELYWSYDDRDFYKATTSGTKGATFAAEEGTNWLPLTTDKATNRTQATGLLSGGVITKDAGNTVSWTAGTGRTVDPSDPELVSVADVSWSAVSGHTPTNLATDGTTVFGYDKNGTLVEKLAVALSPEDEVDLVLFGSCTHEGGNIIKAQALPGNLAYGGIESFRLFAQMVIGPANIAGNIYGPNGANLNLDVLGGSAFIPASNFRNNPKIPDTPTLPSGTAISFSRVYNEASPSTNIGYESLSTTSVDPSQWDNNGTLTSVTAGYWTIQHIYRSRDGATFVAYGQAEYSTKSAAVAAVPNEIINENSPLPMTLFRASLVVQQGATALNNTAQAEFFERSSFRTGGVSGSTSSIPGITNPGGSDTNVQFNDSGSFGGESAFAYNKTTDTLTVPNASVDTINSTDFAVKAGTQSRISASSSSTAITSPDGNGGLSVANTLTTLDGNFYINSSEITFNAFTASKGLYLDSSKKLTTTPPTSGALGYWDRTGIVISPATAGDSFAVDTDVFYVDAANDRVGIGTNTPSTTLDVEGDVKYIGASYSLKKSFTFNPSTATTLHTQYLGTYAANGGAVEIEILDLGNAHFSASKFLVTRHYNRPPILHMQSNGLQGADYKIYYRNINATAYELFFQDSQTTDAVITYTVYTDYNSTVTDSLSASNDTDINVLTPILLTAENSTIQLQTLNLIGDIAMNSNDITTGGTATFTTFSGDLNGTINTATTGVTQSPGDNSTKIATTAYVDASTTSQDLDFAGDTGTGDVALGSQTFTISGTANEVETSASGQTITIGLPASISANLVGNVTGNIAGDLTGNVTATSVLADGVSATTQSASDNSTKVATTAYVDAAVTGEDFWHRTGGVLSPQNADDAIQKNNALYNKRVDLQFTPSTRTTLYTQYLGTFVANGGPVDIQIVDFGNSHFAGSFFRVTRSYNAAPIVQSQNEGAQAANYKIYYRSLNATEYELFFEDNSGTPTNCIYTAYVNYNKPLAASTISAENDTNINACAIGLVTKQTGRVGIGTNTPAASLDVAGNIFYTGGTIARSGVVSGTWTPNTTGLFFGYDSSQDRAFFSSGVTNGSGVFTTRKPAIFDYSTFTFSNGGTTDLFINSIGNIGIGTNTQTAKLEVLSTATTTNVLDVSGDSLTEGSIARFYSNSATSDDRRLVQIVNDNANANSAECLHIQQDAADPAIFINDNASGGLLHRVIDINITDASSSATTAIDINHAGAGPLFEGFGNCTNQSAFRLDCNSLTFGSIAQFYSTSADASTRDLMLIQNGNAASTGTTVLKLEQNSTGLALDCNGASDFSGIANFQSEIDIAENTRRGVARVYNASIGDTYGMEQVSTSQTGDGAQTRLFTANVSSAKIALGRYTDSTTFEDWLKLSNTQTTIAKATAINSDLDVNGYVYQVPFGGDQTGNVFHHEFRNVNNVNQYDQSGYGNDVTFDVAAQVAVGNGRYGGAAAGFNGSSDFGQSTTTNFPTGSSPRTFECLVKILDITLQSGVIMQYGNALEDQLFSVEQLNQTLRVFTPDASVYTGNILQENQWYFIQVTYDGSNIDMWVNNVQVITNGALTLNTASGSTCYIGTRADATDYFTGYIDYIRLYDRELAEEERKTHYLRFGKVDNTRANGNLISAIPNGTTEVWTADDLGQTVGGVLTIQTGYYKFMAPIDFGTTRWEFAENASVQMFAENSFRNVITYSGSDTFITGNGSNAFRVFYPGMSFYLTGNNSTFINMTGSFGFQFSAIVCQGTGNVLGTVNGSDTGVTTAGRVFANQSVTSGWVDGFTFNNVDKISWTEGKQSSSTSAMGAFMHIKNVASFTNIDKLEPFINNANAAFIDIDPLNEAEVIIESSPLTGVGQYFLSGSSGTFTAVADGSIGTTSITSVTDSSGTARFNYSGPLLFVNQKATISGYTTRTQYNGSFNVTAVGAGYFEINGIDYEAGTDSGSFLSNSIALSSVSHGLSNGDTVLLNTTNHTDYDLGTVVYDVQTNHFRVNAEYNPSGNDPQSGTWNAGSLTQDSKYVNADKNGVQADSVSYGSIAWNGNSDTTSISSGTYNNIDTGGTLTVQGSRFKVVNADIGQIVYTGLNRTLLKIEVNLWPPSGSVIEANYRVAVNINDETLTYATTPYAPLQLKDVGDIARYDKFVTLNPGDTIKVQMAGDGTSENITLAHGQIFLKGVS